VDQEEVTALRAALSAWITGALLMQAEDFFGIAGIQTANVGGVADHHAIDVTFKSGVQLRVWVDQINPPVANEAPAPV
jgi:hypothetical protein